MRFRTSLLVAAISAVFVHAVFAASLLAGPRAPFVDLLLLPHNALSLLYGDMPKGPNAAELVTASGVAKNLLVALPASAVYGVLIAALGLLISRMPDRTTSKA